MCVLAVTLWGLASSVGARAGDPVAVDTMEVRVANVSTQYRDSSADREWLESWARAPIARRDVILQGHSPTGESLPRVRYRGCTLTSFLPGAKGLMWVGLACDSSTPAD